MRIKDETRVNGAFHLRVYKNGVLVEESEDHNMIVNGAKVEMAHLIAGNVTNRHIATIALGTSGTAAAAGNTTITNSFTKAITGVEYPANGQVKFKWSIAATEANEKAILEFGLLCADGTLFARYVRTSVLNKDSDFSLEGDWTIEF